MPESNAEPEDEHPDKTRTKKIVRRLGYVVFIGGGFLFFVMLMVGVVRGIQNDRVWDPYTGLPHRGGTCFERASALVRDAPRDAGLTTQWEGRYRDWVVRCKDDHAELYELLKRTRLDLQHENETHSDE